jgi:hypothetical protein
MTAMTIALAILAATLAVGLAFTVVELRRVRKQEREILTREAMVEARKQLAAEKDLLDEAKLRQAFEAGILEGLKRAAKENKIESDAVFQQGLERGLLEGERNAEQNFRIEHWTEIKKNQGYFFTSAEVVACFQLMYKNIPLGQPQRYTVETSETVDRIALDKMVDRVLGQSALGPAANNLQGLRVVSRDGSDDKPTLAIPNKASR